MKRCTLLKNGRSTVVTGLTLSTQVKCVQHVSIFMAELLLATLALEQP